MEPTKEYGWRLLAVGEEIKEGDEVFRHSADGWFKCETSIGTRLRDSNKKYFRRRIDPGAGFEIIPENEPVPHYCEATDNGVDWIPASWGPPQPTVAEAFKLCQHPPRSGTIAWRRRKQPESEWIDIKVCKPEASQVVWFYSSENGIRIGMWYGAGTTFTHWKPIKTGELPQPPVVQKSQEELDKEASQKWYQSDSDNADTLCEQALRQAFEAGLKAGRKS